MSKIAETALAAAIQQVANMDRNTKEAVCDENGLDSPLSRCLLRSMGWDLIDSN